MKQKQTRLSEINKNLQLEMVDSCRMSIEAVKTATMGVPQAFPMLTINPVLHQTPSQAKADKTLGDGREPSAGDGGGFLAASFTADS